MAFAVEEDPGSERLLVAFPKLRSATARPPVALGRHLEGLRGHRLYLGADRDRYIGPNQELLGLKTAVELVAREATRLAVPPEQVVFFGTSMAAGCALMVGLVWGTGTVVAGGVPVLSGSMLRRMAKRGPTGEKRAALSVIDSARRTDPGEDPVSFLDELCFRLAETLDEPLTAHLITSPSDYADRGVRRFARFAEDQPYLSVTLHEGAYERHNGVGDEFFALLRRVVDNGA